MLVRRAPPRMDAQRWHHAIVGGRGHRFAQPLTFTPYAAARPCSARCRFCSETLRPMHGGTMAARLRPAADYFATLEQALAAVRGIPMSWSLSGLEASDNEAWLLQLLETLSAEERRGAAINERVLYSNGAGLARARGDELIDALRRFGLSWIELSRHHPDPARNQAIMRFRPDEPIADVAGFAGTARRVSEALPLRLVCIVQRGGVEDADGVMEYLRWAEGLGATAVIFREFSRLDEVYRDTVTRRYIEGGRVTVERVLEACMAAAWWPSLVPVRMTEGYYFWNLVLRAPSGMEVVFETSDYGAMHDRHQTGDVYKLVFHANGNLCTGWEPDHGIIWRAARG
ncbi:hypothetical protein FKV23_15385 [Lysobacter alkalisoli]|uniref:Radical SAM protein n=2 Tax=Marilutibacter alkalisoli TaxID=2591633 RepID=A0A514BWZ1_9GAMM|nr:radical SAM protein [Lysobacter alkalisoli]QDH71911.1 hypothetical protein FKV23_15385 [Lysobacter alkalisoli]